MTEDPAKYEGKWVTTNIEFLMTDYVEHYTETTYESGAKSTSTDGNSYIAFYSEGDPTVTLPIWYFYSVYLTKSNQEWTDKLMDETWEYWNDVTGEVPLPEPVKVTGTWEKLDGQILNYYLETLEDDMGMVEGPDNIFNCYTIATNKIGGVTQSMIIMFMVVALIALIYIIIQVVKLCGKGYAKAIDEFIAKHPGTNISYIESDFAAARRIGKEKVWIGRNWTIYVTGTKVHIFANGEAIWAYYYRRTGKNAVSQMQVYVLNDKTHYINLSESQTQEAMGYYAAEQPQMVLGYTPDLQKLYKSNLQEFLNLKYTPARQQMSQDPFNGI